MADSTTSTQYRRPANLLAPNQVREAEMWVTVARQYLAEKRAANDPGFGEAVCARIEAQLKYIEDVVALATNPATEIVEA